MDVNTFKKQYISICKNCNEEFIDNEPKSKAHKFCSKGCEQNFSRETYGKGICKNCGKSFYYDVVTYDNGKKDYRKTKYCSENCLQEFTDKNKKKTTICKNCGKEFQLKSRKDKYGKTHYYSTLYCCDSCAKEYYDKTHTVEQNRKFDKQGNALKQCSLCKNWKYLNEFYNDKIGKDGLSSRCKSCIKKTKNRNSDYDKKYYQQNVERLKEYYQQNKEHKLNYQRMYNEEHKEQRNLQKQQYYQQNKDRINELRRQKYKENSLLKLNMRMSNFINKALKNNKYGEHWEDFLPYSLEEIKSHLESQFDENMNWDNYGSYWEIDHIIPKNIFNYTSHEDYDFKICWSLANLRPLSITENRSRPKDGSDISEEIKQQIFNQDVNSQDYKSKINISKCVSGDLIYYYHKIKNKPIIRMLDNTLCFGITQKDVLELCLNSKFPGSNVYESEHPIWNGYVNNKKSPKEAWIDEEILSKAICNWFYMICFNDFMLNNNPENKSEEFLIKNYYNYNNRWIKYLKNWDTENICKEVLNRFTVAKFAPKVTALSYTTVYNILNTVNIDLSTGVYCPMAGFGGIIEGSKKYFKDHNINAEIEAYDINKEFCEYFGWTERDALAQKIKTDKVLIACPPFSDKDEHWINTPDVNAAGLSTYMGFHEWCKKLIEFVDAKNYILIGPTNENKNKSTGLFAKTTGVSWYPEYTKFD